MKKLSLIFFSLVSFQSFGVSPMDSVLATAQGEALTIKSSCIDMPPLTAEQAAWCSGHYSTYIGYLTALQSPMPLTLNTGTDGYQSPYSWSPYDICRFEPGRLINIGIC